MILYKNGVVASGKKIVGLVGGLVVAGFVAVIWCILMHFSWPFSALYIVHIHSVLQKCFVFNGFSDLQIRHNLHFAE